MNKAVRFALDHRVEIFLNDAGIAFEPGREDPDCNSKKGQDGDTRPTAAGVCMSLPGRRLETHQRPERKLLVVNIVPLPVSLSPCLPRSNAYTFAATPQASPRPSAHHSNVLEDEHYLDESGVSRRSRPRSAS